MKFFKIPIIKMITRMSIYAFVFLLANPLLATTFYGQSLEKTKVSISLQKATVIEVFKIIEKQTPFSFVYDKSVVIKPIGSLSTTRTFHFYRCSKFYQKKIF